MTKKGYMECPVCAEEIRDKAKMCRFCGAALSDEALPRIISLPPRQASPEPNENLDTEEEKAELTTEYTEYTEREFFRVFGVFRGKKRAPLLIVSRCEVK